MDPKSDMKMDGRADKSKLVGASMLLLSLLLTASVASLIYVAVPNGNSACQAANQVTSEIDVKASLAVKSENGETKERIEYSHGGHMSYMYGSNGEFDFDDFRKGIHLTKNTDDGVCYMIPVGSNQTVDRQVEGFLKEWDGKELEIKPVQVEVELIGGRITDVSFLPQKVQAECTHGYQWMAVIAQRNEADKDDGVNRDKRSFGYPFPYSTYFCCYPVITICQTSYYGYGYGYGNRFGNGGVVYY